MSVNKKGSQRNVYLSNEEWKEYDRLSKREGFPGESGFMVFLFRQYVCGNLVFKRNK